MTTCRRPILQNYILRLHLNLQRICSVPPPSPSRRRRSSSPLDARKLWGQSEATTRYKGNGQARQWSSLSKRNLQPIESRRKNTNSWKTRFTSMKTRWRAWSTRARGCRKRLRDCWGRSTAQPTRLRSTPALKTSKPLMRRSKRNAIWRYSSARW